MKASYTRMALYICALSLFGCANTETWSSRRASGEPVDVGGTKYATGTENEAAILGTSGSGLNTSSSKEPGKQFTGSTGQYESFESITLSPSGTFKTHINQINEFNVDFVAGDTKGAVQQFVITLEKAAGANGSLSVDSDYRLKKDDTSTDTQIIVKPVNNQITFRLSTGTSYHATKPMYRVTVWQADCQNNEDCVKNSKNSVDVYVHEIPQISDDLTEGTTDTVNDETDTSTDKTSNLTSAILVNLDNLEQKLYAESEQKLRVKLTGTCKDDPTGADCSVEKEPICWTFVETTAKNPSFVSEDASSKGKFKNGKQFEDSKKQKGINKNCGETDQNGEFWVNVSTASSYGAKYFLNFYHPLASENVTYTITTYAMGKTGDPGDEAKLTEEGLEVDTSKAKDEAGSKVLSGCAAADLLKGIFYPVEDGKTQIDDEELDPVKVEIEKKCGDMDKCTGNDGCPKDKSFNCKLVQNTDRTWSLQTCDGTNIMTDVNGDKLDDPVRLVFAQDGKGETFFQGYDTNYDGKVEVAPNPCLYTKYVKLCDDATQKMICSTKKDGTFGPCSSIIHASLDETQSVYVKLIDIKKDTEKSGTINVDLKKGSYKSNNGMLIDSAKNKDKVEHLTDLADDSKVFTIPFWTGNAYDALYFLETSAKKAKPVLIPILVNNSLNLPTYQGGDHSEVNVEDAKTPPSEMDPYIPDIGPVTISLPEGGVQSISSPVVKTLALQVLVSEKDSNPPKPIKNTKTWWKVTRSKSVNDNATITNNSPITNNDGIATNNFYTGTGVDSLYYVSVFHPNAKDDKDNLIPFVFTITTTNDTGSIPSLPPSEPEQPKDPWTPNPIYPEKVSSCGSLITCTKEEDIAKCYNEGNKPECCIPQKNKEGEAQCLELIVDGDSYKTTKVGESIDLKVKLIWKNGSTMEPVHDNILWTLNSPAGADASLSASKSHTDDKGVATIKFNAGSKATTYQVNAMYPNLKNGENMDAKSIYVTVTGTMSDKSEPTNINNINVTADSSGVSGTSFDSVSYYALSADYHSCGSNFVINDKDTRESDCEALPSSSSLGGAPNFCSLEGTDAGDSYKASDRSSTPQKYIIYAVANQGDKPVAIGCEGPFSFGPAYSPLKCKKADKYTVTLDDGSTKDVCKPVRDLNATIKLGPIPDEIQQNTNYTTETVLDLAPYLKEGTELGNSLEKFIENYNKFVNKDPANLITDHIVNYIVFDDVGATDYKSERANICLKAFYEYDHSVCTYPGKDQKLEKVDSCSEYNKNAMGSVENIGQKVFYTSCNCPCANIFYESAIERNSQATRAVVKTIVQPLVDKYLSPENVQKTVCDAFDSIQFVKLIGSMNLTEMDGVYDGKIKYSNFDIIKKGEKRPISPVSESSWKEAKVVENKFVVTDDLVNFRYGKFLIEAFQTVLSDKFVDNNGAYEFTKLFDCNTVFGSPISVGSTSVPVPVLTSLCNTAFAEVGKFAGNLGITDTSHAVSFVLQGSGELSRGNKPEKTKFSYKAKVIKNGKWEGIGSLGKTRLSASSSDRVKGAWIAYTDADDKPEIVFDGQSLEAYMSANSICKQMMSK